MKFTNPDIIIENEYKNWIHKFDDLSSDYLYNNYILTKFFKKLGYNINQMDKIQLYNLLKPIGDHLKKNYEEYIDVYSQDKNNFQVFTCLKKHLNEYNDLRQPMILLSDGEYIAHIYRTNPKDDDEARFIGIRESLYNTLNKLYDLPAVKGIGYILLNAMRDYLITQNIEYIVLLSPIGPMRHIALKYGFIDDEYNIENDNVIMSIHDQPKLIIEKCTSFRCAL